MASQLRAQLEYVRHRVAELVTDFERSDRFFKMRVGIVAAWCVLSVATLWGACSISGASNTLGADVQVKRDSIIMGVQFLVRNDSGRRWEDVVLTLDDGWKHSLPVMRPGDQVVLSVTSFKKDDQAPPRDYKPRSLAIACEQGSYRFDLR